MTVVEVGLFGKSKLFHGKDQVAFFIKLYKIIYAWAPTSKKNQKKIEKKNLKNFGLGAKNSPNHLICYWKCKMPFYGIKYT